MDILDVMIDEVRYDKTYFKIFKILLATKSFWNSLNWKNIGSSSMKSLETKETFYHFLTLSLIACNFLRN